MSKEDSYPSRTDRGGRRGVVLKSPEGGEGGAFRRRMGATPSPAMVARTALRRELQVKQRFCECR